MRLRLTKVDEYQFLTCLSHELWGSRSARFRDWREGDRLAFIVGKSLAGLAGVSGRPFQSKDKIWDNGLFPHRIRVKFTHVLKPQDRAPILGEVRDVLTTEWGPNYGWGILNQHVLESPAADVIVKAISSCPNGISEYRSEILGYLAEAKIRRDQPVALKPRGRPPKRRDRVKQLEIEGLERDSAHVGLEHTKAQSQLITLGRLCGCSVWIATNDKGRSYRGRLLSENCLKSLPKMGLSDEAARRIALIDVIWLKQQSPVCAFEIETSTSVYSGLLRMSDLLSVVPALKLQIFIVAPEARRDRVLSELSRPTFRKIGLADYCRYISTEALSNLLAKVEDLGGHIQETVLDKIALAVEEEHDEDSP